MADVMKLKKGATEVNFSPLAREGAYLEPEDQGRVTHLTLDKTVYQYDFADKYLKSVTINNMSQNNAGTIKNWFKAGSTIKYFPDMINAASTSITVKIMGERFPLQIMPEGGWRESEWATCKYTGTLILREA